MVPAQVGRSGRGPGPVRAEGGGRCLEGAKQRECWERGQRPPADSAVTNVSQSRCLWRVRGGAARAEPPAGNRCGGKQPPDEVRAGVGPRGVGWMTRRSRRGCSRARRVHRPILPCTCPGFAQTSAAPRPGPRPLSCMFPSSSRVSAALLCAGHGAPRPCLGRGPAHPTLRGVCRARDTRHTRCPVRVHLPAFGPAAAPRQAPPGDEQQMPPAGPAGLGGAGAPGTAAMLPGAGSPNAAAAPPPAGAPRPPTEEAGPRAGSPQKRIWPQCRLSEPLCIFREI